MRIRLGTWNVRYGWGEEKNARRLRLLRQLDADIWVLTGTNDVLDLSDTHRAVSLGKRFLTEPGGRWVTIWCRLPLVTQEPTHDGSRTVAARFTGSDGTDLVVFGTVLPWMHDKGPDRLVPAPGWSELHRVIPLQGAEWRQLREQHPDAHCVMAGDLNVNLGGKHYYGTREARSLLRSALRDAQMDCLTESERFLPGQLDHPPIDHICAGPATGQTMRSVVIGWNNTTIDGARLSDHSGVLAEIEFA